MNDHANNTLTLRRTRIIDLDLVSYIQGLGEAGTHIRSYHDTCSHPPLHLIYTAFRPSLPRTHHTQLNLNFPSNKPNRYSLINPSTKPPPPTTIRLTLLLLALLSLFALALAKDEYGHQKTPHRERKKDCIKSCGIQWGKRLIEAAFNNKGNLSPN